MSLLEQPRRSLGFRYDRPLLVEEFELFAFRGSWSSCCFMHLWNIDDTIAAILKVSKVVLEGRNLRISDSVADNLCGEIVMRYLRSDNCTSTRKCGNGRCEMWQCINLVPVYVLNYTYVFKAT